MKNSQKRKTNSQKLSVTQTGGTESHGNSNNYLVPRSLGLGILQSLKASFSWGVFTISLFHSFTVSVSPSSLFHTYRWNKLDGENTVLLFLINIFTLLIKEVVSVVFKHTFFSLRSMVSSLHHYECENFRTVFLRKSTINLNTCPVPGTNNLQMLSEKKKKKDKNRTIIQWHFPWCNIPAFSNLQFRDFQSQRLHLQQHA